MKRIHKGGFYRETSKGEVVVMSIKEVERVNATNSLFPSIILIDPLNPERIGSLTTCHAYGVVKVDLDIKISKI